MTYRPPPEGWQDFGTHAPLSPVPPLTFSDETGEDGLPLWERHDDCRCEDARGGDVTGASQPACPVCHHDTPHSGGGIGVCLTSGCGCDGYDGPPLLLQPSAKDEARARIGAFLDWWHPQHGDVIGTWTQQKYPDGEVEVKIELRASDLRLLVDGPTPNAPSDRPEP